MMAEALGRWLREEMELPPSAAPSPAAIRRLCSGPTAPIWDFVTRHVRSQRNVKKIRGNLRWYRHQQELEAGAGPPSRQGALSAAVARLRKELQGLGDAIEGAQETVQRLEASLGAGQSRRWAELRRGAELRLLGAEPQPEYLRRGHQGALMGPQYRPSQSRAELSAILASGAEPEVLVSIKALCKAREAELQRPRPPRKPQEEAPKAQDWLEQAEAVLIGYSPEAVLWALEALANQSTRELLAGPAPSPEAPPTLSSLIQECWGAVGGVWGALPPLLARLNRLREHLRELQEHLGRDPGHRLALTRAGLGGFWGSLSRGVQGLGGEPPKTPKSAPKHPKSRPKTPQNPSQKHPKSRPKPAPKLDLKSPESGPKLAPNSSEFHPDLAPKFVLKSPEPDPKLAPNSSKFDPKLAPNSSKFDPKLAPNSSKFDPKLAPKSAPNSSESDPKLAPNSLKFDPESVPKSAPNSPKLAPKSAPNSPKSDPELAPKSPKLAPKSAPNPSVGRLRRRLLRGRERVLQGQQRLRFLSAAARGRRAALRPLQEQVVGVARAGPGSAPPPLEGEGQRRRGLVLGALGALGAPLPPPGAPPPLRALGRELGAGQQGALLSRAAILRQQLRQGALCLRRGAGPALGAWPEPAPPLPAHPGAELLPRLRLVSAACRQRIAAWPRLQDLVSQWWSQPAQWALATPPGHAPFSHWLQRWRDAAHALQATPTLAMVTPTAEEGAGSREEATPP